MAEVAGINLATEELSARPNSCSPSHPDSSTATHWPSPALEQLWPLRITTLDERGSKEAATLAWDVIAHIKVSTSRTQIVAGSKFLHHVLPDLVPPIDRQYTFNFFTGQKMVPSDRTAFQDWFPRLADIGRRCRTPIQDAITRKGFMATGEAKVIDNAIMGFMQQLRRAVAASQTNSGFDATGPFAGPQVPLSRLTKHFGS